MIICHFIRGPWDGLKFESNTTPCYIRATYIVHYLYGTPKPAYYYYRLGLNTKIIDGEEHVNYFHDEDFDESKEEGEPEPVH